MNIKHPHAVLKQLTILSLLALLFLLNAACSLGQLIGVNEVTNTVRETTDRTLPILDDAIDRLESESGDWQAVLRDTTDQLTRDGQSTIANEVSTVLTRSVAASGAEVRCDADFFRVRVQQDLMGIKARLLGETVPPKEPEFCQVVPLSVDVSLVEANRLKTLEFYGYDFDTTPVKVLMGNEDVSQYLARPTHYHLTLDLTGIGSDKLRRNSQFALRWENKEISTVSIVKPETPRCRTQTVKKRPSEIEIIPTRLVKGDKEFQSHGPQVNVKVRLLSRASHLDIEATMSAREPTYDYSETRATKTYTAVYEPPTNWVIKSIKGNSVTEYSYTDNDWEADVFSPGVGPVQRLECIGDGEGADIGINTRCKFYFKELEIELLETGDCKR